MDGGERVVTQGLTNQKYKFEDKERDPESASTAQPQGLDYFGARFDSSATGRFMSPDWANKPEPVPYAKLGNPQTLNLYAFAGNNPESAPDIDGHEESAVDSFNQSFAQGMSDACGDGIAFACEGGDGQQQPGSTGSPQTQSGSTKPKPTNQPVDPVPTGPDGEPTPPPVPVPGCPTCKWVWNPDKRPNSDDPGRWVPDNYPKTPSGIPEGHWDPGSRGGPGHWDVDQGNGTRTKHYPDGSPMPDNVAHPPGWRPIWNSITGWVSDHRREVIVGVVVVGVGAAIIATGGAAAPLALAIP